ncbi:MAG: sensor histidine kinase [Bdellovibrionales bacterium]|nr:sensor histidine kinase [Bdellovibrionales bacterium]
MFGALKKKKTLTAYGLFSKPEAAEKIVAGARHVHSSNLGAHDPLVAITEGGSERGLDFSYPWERRQEAQFVEVRSAEDRHKVLRELVGLLGTDGHSTLKDVVGTVLEELISNAIYHGLRLKNGERKFNRFEKPQLQPSEYIKVGTKVAPNGVYVSVEDSGGSLTFEDIQEAFYRCYQRGLNQIQQKDNGAGLGLYMSFDQATHLRIDVWPGKKTVVSCWINRKRVPNEDNFSFNYFERT